MRVEILCITFSRDRVFLQALLASIQKFASGFAAVHVIVPTHEFRLFHEFVPDWVKLASYREEPGKGMLQHEAEILRADFWCPKADAILHVDADCVFTQPVSPSDYLNLYRPILYRDKLIAFWSHGGPDAVCDRDMDFPGGNTLGQTPRQVWKALDL